QASALRRGERALVVVDEQLSEAGSQLLAAARDAGAEPELHLWAGERPLTRVPPAMLEAAQRADVLFSLQQEPRGDEASLRFELNETTLRRGGRGLFLGFVDATLLAEELSLPAPDLAAVAEGLLAQVRGADSMRLRNPAGTDLLFRVTGRPWLTDARPLQAGEYGNYPGGEIFVAPLEDSADGILVADLTVPYTVEGLVDEPVILRFEAGRVTSIEGGRAASMLQDLVEEAGSGGDVIAELGIGLNPTVRPRGHVMLDEKAAGTAHVAIGRNTGSYGGANESSIHVDCILSSPEIEVDGRALDLPA
ncbi:MAG TPA: aminopeptidase, partial [Gaiellaceae bacterium]|nr:aminopeptidase [Gaiellaceae bacterium]